jgi:glyoxylase-like metal-dependent hydrolase (beta-lactamase superfamily II)
MEHARITIDADVIPRFTACYLRIAGGECAFVEAHTAHALPRLLAALEASHKRPEDVRFIIVTHAHLDHAAGAGALLASCPNATLVAHPRTAKHLVDPEKLVAGARLVYGDKFDALYGEVKPIPKERVLLLQDGESVALGDAKLTAWHTYGHAFHHFIVDDPMLDTVYTGDAFGLVYPALQTYGRFALPSTSPTGFNAVEARKSLAKVESLRRGIVCPTHFDGWPEVTEIGAQVGRFIDRAGRWVDEAAKTNDPLEAIEARLVEEWWKAIDEEAPRFGESEKKHLGLDVKINAQGLAHAADVMRRAAPKIGA